MIDPPTPEFYQNFKAPQILLEILKFRFSLHMVKMIDLPGILLEILKFRFSLHMIKDDWLPP